MFSSSSSLSDFGDQELHFVESGAQRGGGARQHVTSKDDELARQLLRTGAPLTRHSDVGGGLGREMSLTFEDSLLGPGPPTRATGGPQFRQPQARSESPPDPFADLDDSDDDGDLGVYFSQVQREAAEREGNLVPQDSDLFLVPGLGQKPAGTTGPPVYKAPAYTGKSTVQGNAAALVAAQKMKKGLFKNRGRVAFGEYVEMDDKNTDNLSREHSYLTSPDLGIDDRGRPPVGSRSEFPDFSASGAAVRQPNLADLGDEEMRETPLLAPSGSTGRQSAMSAAPVIPRATISDDVGRRFSAVGEFLSAVGEKAFKKLKKALPFIVGAVLIFLLVLFIVSFKYVDRQTFAVIRSTSTQALQRDSDSDQVKVYTNGRYFIGPFQEVIQFKSTIQTMIFGRSLHGRQNITTALSEDGNSSYVYLEAPEVFAKEGTVSKLDFAVHYRMHQEGIPKLLARMGFDDKNYPAPFKSGNEDRTGEVRKETPLSEWRYFIAATVQAAVLEATPHFSVQQLITDRNATRDELTRVVDKALSKKLGVKLHKLQLGWYTIPSIVREQKAYIFDTNQKMKTNVFNLSAKTIRQETLRQVTVFQNAQASVQFSAENAAELKIKKAQYSALSAMEAATSSELERQINWLNVTALGRQEELRTYNLMLDDPTASGNSSSAIRVLEWWVPFGLKDRARGLKNAERLIHT